MWLEIIKYDAFSFALFSQEYFGYLGSSVAPWIFFYFCEKCNWNFERSYIKAIDHFGSIDVLIILIPPIQECVIFLHLVVFSSIPFISIW